MKRKETIPNLGSRPVFFSARCWEENKKIHENRKMETGYRARTHLAGCGVHATQENSRRFPKEKKNKEKKQHRERDTLILALRAAELRHT
jgi:hypothetical protein